METYRQEEPMDIDYPRSDLSRTVSVSRSQTATGSTTNYQQSHWSFFSKDVLLVKHFYGRDLDKRVDDGIIKLKAEKDKLIVTCLTTSHALAIADFMQKLKSRIDQLQSHIKTVVIDHMLSGSSLIRITKYVEQRNTTIEDAYLHMEESRWVYIYGLNNDVAEREKKQLKALQEKLQSESKMPSYASKHHPSSLGSGLQTAIPLFTTVGSSSSSYPRYDQSVISSTSTPQPGLGKIPLFTTVEGIKVFVYKHSITSLHTDAIVNAANEDLRHIGGVAKAISERAGIVVDYKCSSIISKRGRPLSVTDNVATEAGYLASKHIIHAVGPRWDKYQDKEQCLMDLCWTVGKALDKAAELECIHVGMPAISAGIFGVPKILCAEMYITGIVQHSQHRKKRSCLREIHIVDIDDEIIQEMNRASKKWQVNPKSLRPKESYRQFSNARPKSSQSGSLHHKDSTRNGNGWSKFWIHCDPSRIKGLDDSVENFESDDGFVKVKIYTGSIVRVRDVDAILCSADFTLSGQGPLGTAIRTAGGHLYETEFKYLQGSANTSKEKVYKCKAGNLPVQYVVHVVMDALTKVDGYALKKYKHQIYYGFEKVNSWKLKSVALPLVGAGFVEKIQFDLDKVCEVMQESLMDFCRKPGTLCEVHMVNRNSCVTDTLVKYFKKNSTKHQQQKPRANETTGRFQDQGARPKSTSYSLDSPGNSRQPGGKRALFSTSVTNSSQKNTSPQKFSQTVNPNSWRAANIDVEDSNALKGEQREISRKTRLKQKETLGNLNVLDGTEAKSSKNQTELSNNLKGGQQNICSSCKKPYQEMTTLQCGHSFCTIPCFIPMISNRICAVCHTKDERDANRESSNIIDDESSDEYNDVNDIVKMDEKTDDMCVICMDDITNKMQLQCGHVFCSDCINQSMAHKPTCPVCGKIFGKLEGDQPENGKMTEKRSGHSLPGFEGYGTIEISYKFQDGIQKENHPHPGKRYKGTERRAFLPDNKEGQKVLRLLRKAFVSRLTFTIGSSRTTGQEDVVTWNDIHHKTTREGGAVKFGYPDPTYLSRVQDELAAKGIKE